MTTIISWARSLTVAGIVCLFFPEVSNSSPTGLRKQFLETPLRKQFLETHLCKQLLETPGLLPPASYLPRFKECDKIIERSSVDIRGWFRNCSAATAFQASSKHDSSGLPPCTNAASLRTKCVFMSPVHLKQFIKLLDLKYAILGRPRFGKRSGDPGSRLPTTSHDLATDRRQRSSIHRDHSRNNKPDRVSQPSFVVPTMAYNEGLQRQLPTQDWKMDVRLQNTKEESTEKNFPHVAREELTDFARKFGNGILDPRLKHSSAKSFSGEDFDRNDLLDTFGNAISLASRSRTHLRSIPLQMTSETFFNLARKYSLQQMN